MRITNKKYFTEFVGSIQADIEQLLTRNSDFQQEVNFEFRMRTSAVYSSNIEGNSIDINSYMNSEMAEEAFKPKKAVEEISDLVRAYEFAFENSLNEQNVLKAHSLLSNTILITDKRGKYRTGPMGVYDNSGLVYFAVEPEKVSSEMSLLFKDIKLLLNSELSVSEVFYHAALIHLKFAQIHPFWDGNGRAARLLEKWFLAECLGRKVWKIESEHFYKDNISLYYKNINLGMDYYALKYDHCLPFLKMLVDSLSVGD